MISKADELRMLTPDDIVALGAALYVHFLSVDINPDPDVLQLVSYEQIRLLMGASSARVYHNHREELWQVFRTIKEDNLYEPGI